MKINREIALEGLLLKAISPLPYEKMQRLMGPLSTKVLGVFPLKSPDCIESGKGDAAVIKTTGNG